MPSKDNIFEPTILDELGSLHPINQIKDSISEFLSGLGFEIIDGPEIETEEYNFDLLNIKKLILLGKCMTLST